MHISLPNLRLISRCCDTTLLLGNAGAQVDTASQGFSGLSSPLPNNAVNFYCRHLTIPALIMGKSFILSKGEASVVI